MNHIHRSKLTRDLAEALRGLREALMLALDPSTKSNAAIGRRILEADSAAVSALAKADGEETPLATPGQNCFDASENWAKTSRSRWQRKIADSAATGAFECSIGWLERRVDCLTPGAETPQPSVPARRPRES